MDTNLMGRSFPCGHQDSACPICGARLGGRTASERAEAWAAHRCRPRSLAAIDGAQRWDDSGVRAWPPEASRLAEGLNLISWCERDDPPTW